jgi:outer membrane protein TolC
MVDDRNPSARSSRGKALRWILLGWCGLAFCTLSALKAQTSPSTTTSILATPTAGQNSAPTAPPSAPIHVSLQDAIERARVISPALRQVVVNEKIAIETPTQNRAANLPTVSGNSQYLYTEGNGTPSARYIANNGVHEYIAQVDVHQALSVANVATYRRSLMAAALAKDQTEIARRGLVVAVVQAYSAVIAAQQKYQTLQQALQTAQDFLRTTQELEHGGEVAHADVVKAQIQSDDSRVAEQDGQLALNSARVALALMVFPDVNQSYELVDDPSLILSLPSFQDAEAAARLHNPELDAAYRSVRMANEAMIAARAEYLPSMTLDYFYGIDANHFAMTTPSNRRLDPELDGRPIQNPGYSALASLTVPIWNWGSTRSKVKSAKAMKELAIEDREYARRKLIANLQQLYAEAQTARSEMEIRRTATSNADESQKLTLLQYKAGNATALEVVTSQDTLTLEQNALADAEARYATSLANLATLTGRLQP